MAVLIKNISTYKQLRPVALEYRKAKDKAKIRREHESTLILYEAAAKALKEQGVMKYPDLYALKAEYKRLAEEKERLYEQYGEAKKQMRLRRSPTGPNTARSAPNGCAAAKRPSDSGKATGSR